MLSIPNGVESMGAAAYQRGNKRISADIDAQQRASEFVLMDDLNALPKHEGASKPFGPIHFIGSHGGWFAECPVSGFGYFYASLREAVRSWQVSITECRHGVFIGVPA